MKRNLIFILCFVLLANVFVCSEVNAKKKNICLKKTNITLEKNEVYNLKVQGVSKKSKKKIKRFSTSKKIAKVNKKGKIKACNEGML